MVAPSGEVKVKLFLLFRVDSKICAIPVQHVVKVLLPVALIEIPEDLHLIRGYINYHGTILPVLDLHKYFTGRSVDISRHHKFIVISKDSAGAVVVVDEIVGIQELTRSSVIKPHGLIEDIAYWKDTPVILLGLSRLFELTYEVLPPDRDGMESVKINGNNQKG
ncbi:MAG TPA: chemotaxis protein CheW [Thermodesulforhabdus norvegica]|uniref:Chemotaxis protein CheW n=1 Tax=Thermodesulforhabdus norvegica TaxID=39841 RepID=A0A7C0WS72_9BACT|nr:chemotaxis protein CheW [Thermodesulforhabdus norvegica]